MLGFQEARSGAAGGQNSSWDKMRMRHWNRSHHILEMVLQPKDHELMVLSSFQISPVFWTLPVVVSLRSFWWEMPQKLFLQLGIEDEGSVHPAVPWGLWCDRSGDEEGFLAIKHVTRSGSAGSAPSFCWGCPFMLRVLGAAPTQTPQPHLQCLRGTVL